MRARAADEVELYAELQRTAIPLGERGARRPARRADLVAAELGMPRSRCSFLLANWTMQGIWSFGANVRCGWFTPTAPPHLDTGERC